MAAEVGSGAGLGVEAASSPGLPIPLAAVSLGAFEREPPVHDVSGLSGYDDARFRSFHTGAPRGFALPFLERPPDLPFFPFVEERGEETAGWIRNPDSSPGKRIIEVR